MLSKLKIRDNLYRNTTVCGKSYTMWTQIDLDIPHSSTMECKPEVQSTVLQLCKIASFFEVKGVANIGIR